MSFLKKLFGSKSESKQNKNPEFIVVTLNDKIQPLDRGFFYEDPLDEYLRSNNWGEVTGGGTMQKENGEIEFVDIEICLNKGVDSQNVAEKIIEFLNNKNAPKKSSLKIEKRNAIMNFGNSEGIGIYLDSQNLDEDVYKTCDSNFVVSEIRRLIGDNTEIVRFWAFPDKTALYFYGNSFEEMKNKISDLINSYPLCKNAEIKQIA